MVLNEAVAATRTQLKRGEFRGAAGEYFGIWIVNILLTIVTFGIYSAWAKVRRNRYFYGNTYLDGHAFDYHARGKQIFIGRLIVFGVLIGINIVSAFVPLVVILFPLVLFAGLPWLFMRGLRFSARVTSYRNVRFDFVGTLGGAYKAVLLGWIVSVVSLGLAVPVATRWYYKWVLDNLRYGDRAFVTRPRLKPIYMAWLVPLTLILVTIIGYGAMDIAILMETQPGDLDQLESSGWVVGAMAISHLLIVIIYPLILLSLFFFHISVRNIVLSATTFDKRHQLVSDIGRLRYLWIVASNFLVSIASLGLMRPWAAVREQRYKVSHTGILVEGEIGEVVAAIGNSGPAASEEFLEMEGFDFGF